MLEIRKEKACFASGSWNCTSELIKHVVSSLSTRIKPGHLTMVLLCLARDTARLTGTIPPKPMTLDKVEFWIS